jgi:hypothetical protein
MPRPLDKKTVMQMACIEDHTRGRNAMQDILGILDEDTKIECLVTN